MPLKNFLRRPSRKSRSQRQANQQAKTPATATPSNAPPKPRMEARSAGGKLPQRPLSSSSSSVSSVQKQPSRPPIPQPRPQLQRRNSTPGRAQGAPSQPRPQLQRRNSTPGRVQGSPPQSVSDLNIGAGNNPMASKRYRNTTNIDMNRPSNPTLHQHRQEAGASQQVNYQKGDATNLPFGPKKFDRIHAINPYGFNPVNSSVAQSVKDDGAIFISGTRNNNFATNEKSKKNKGPKPIVEPASVGLEFVKEKPLSERHKFGKQTKSDGSTLNTSNSFTKVYRKRQPFDGKKFKPEPLPEWL